MAVVLALMIWKIEKTNTGFRRKTNKAKPPPSINKSEIDLNGLYMEKMKKISETKFLEEYKANGGNGIRTYAHNEKKC
jgi:hypothetical protein